MAFLQLKVNGREIGAEIEPDTLLVDFLRENLSLTGTHIACETGQCGACVVLLNGQTVKSCLVLALQAEKAEIVTIEGLRDGENLSPLQQLFRKHHAAQCGYCTSGMILAAHNIKDKDETEIRRKLGGNFCRCTGYQGIVKAIGEHNA